MEERQYWNAYQDAFEDAINKTSTKHCPWYVVPADNKWYMRYVVRKIILSVLEGRYGPKISSSNRRKKA